MKTLAFDTETRGLDWWDPDQRAFLVSWAAEDGAHVCSTTDPEGMAAFNRAVDKADRVVCHNLSFDVHQLRATTGRDLLTEGKELVDTDQLARVVVPERRSKTDEHDEASYGFKLKNLAKTYLGGDSKDAEDAIAELAKQIGVKLKSTGGYYDVWRAFPQETEHYAREDARMTLDLLPKLEAKITDRNRQCWELEQATTPVLVKAEQLGVKIDQARVTPLLKQYTEQRDRNQELVVKELGDEALENNDAMAEALQKIGVPLHRTTKTGQLAVNKFALKEFEPQFPVLAALSEYRTAAKFLATYIGPMVDRDTVHPSFWQQGAWTGRMSASRPNVQNIPARAGSEVREMFVPRKGHVFVVSDYDSIEIKLLAYYLNAPEFTQMLQDGHDPHAWMASNIWGGTSENYAKGGPNDKLRSLAKNILFAIVYGAGAPRVMDMLADAEMDSSREEAKALIKAIKTALPRYNGLAGYKGRIRKKVEATGYVTTLMGRKQPVSRDKAYVGLNALIQGSAADIFKRGIVGVSESVADLGATPILFVHDEVVTEVPTKHAKECLARQEQALRDAFDLSPSLVVSSRICKKNYGEAK